MFGGQCVGELGCFQVCLKLFCGKEGVGMQY